MNIYGGEGNDKIQGPHIANNTSLQGGNGNDKLIGGNQFDE